MARLISCVLAVLVLSNFACGQAAPLVGGGPEATSAKPSPSLPVREVTVFKDGHAYVLHEGKMPVENGQVVLDYLPTPMLGTFWSYSADEKVKLAGVTASQRVVSLDRTALSLRDLLEANIGAEVTVIESPLGQKDEAQRYDATIQGMPEQSSQELDRTAAPGTPPALPIKGDLILLKTETGVKAVPIGRIQEVLFKGGKVQTVGKAAAFRNCLRLKLDFGKDKPAAEAKVGMMYVQKGFRWIPSYRVSIDGKGQAKVQMEATLINELTDLDDATVHLVIGVPSFAMKDTIDPIAMQQTLASLSQYFRPDQRMGGQQFSNAMQSQISSNDTRYTENAPQEPAPADLGPAVPGGGKVEDLYVFPLTHVTLRKGQRMVVPVGEPFTAPYKDVYTLDLPATPPQEVFQSFGNPQKAEVAKLLAAPKVMHKIRLTNSTASPFTTAPAMILSEGKLVAQSLMLYTMPGGSVDLSVTAALDVGVRKSDQEAKREHNAATLEKEVFARVSLEGTVTLLNRKKEALEVEVVRNVIGNIDKADNDGKVQMLNVLEDEASLSLMQGEAYPTWWSWYSWPHWWSRFNGMGRVTWKVKLEAGQKVELKYTWNYYWR